MKFTNEGSEPIHVAPVGCEPQIVEPGESATFDVPKKAAPAAKARKATKKAAPAATDTAPADSKEA